MARHGVCKLLNATRIALRASCVVAYRGKFLFFLPGGTVFVYRQPMIVAVNSASVARQTFFLRRRRLVSEEAEPEADEGGGSSLRLGNGAESVLYIYIYMSFADVHQMLFLFGIGQQTL